MPDKGNSLIWKVPGVYPNDDLKNYLHMGYDCFWLNVFRVHHNLLTYKPMKSSHVLNMLGTEPYNFAQFPMRWIELIAVGGEWTSQGVSQRQNRLETSSFQIY